MRKRGAQCYVPVDPCSSVTGENLSTSLLKHLGVRNRLLHSWENTKLGCDGDREVRMQYVNCKAY
jgi:hypothetical protein